MIYRLPGEKLGLGLRFDGGSKAQELVNRLFVQCCSKASPSARTKCTWGNLADGDEIISISGKLVRRMTRVDCVKALKGRNVIQLLTYWEVVNRDEATAGAPVIQFLRLVYDWT